MRDVGEATADAVDDDALEPIEPPAGHDCEEHDPADAQARGEATAEARGWGPGWPTDNGSKMKVVRAGGIALSVRAELAPLIERLVLETTARGYALRHGQCWGFANRAIRGTKKPSNHSWGLAVDLNAPANPMGPTLVTDMPQWMVDLWTSKQFRWGGSYKGRKDAMHYEFMGTPADAARIIAEFGDAPIDLTGTQKEKPQEQAPAARPKLRRKDRGPAVELLQQRLNANGAAIEIDGVFGEATENAVKAFQTAKQLEVDGIVGPKTWEALG
jgi:hypothetical protein